MTRQSKRRYRYDSTSNRGIIVGDENPMAKAYELVKQENGLLVSLKKETK